MNSSARTEVFDSTSTRSMAMVGTSERMTRRMELAKARSTLRRMKSTLTFVACSLLDRGYCKNEVHHTSLMVTAGPLSVPSMGIS